MKQVSSFVKTCHGDGLSNYSNLEHIMLEKRHLQTQLRYVKKMLKIYPSHRLFQDREDNLIHWLERLDTCAAEIEQKI